MRKMFSAIALAVTTAVTLTCVTPIAHADTFSNDDMPTLRNKASQTMEKVYQQSEKVGIPRTVFSNDDIPSAPVGGVTNVPTTPHKLAYGDKDDSFNESGVYRGYMGNVDSPALMNDSEAGRYFRRKNTGASIPAGSCQASLTNLLPDRQLLPNATTVDNTGVDQIFNGPGLDAILTAVKQAQEPYMSEWAMEAVEIQRTPGPKSPYGENKSRAAQRYNRELMLRGYGRTKEEQERLRYMVESAEKDYWQGQLSTYKAQNTLWIPLTIAILSGDRAKVSQVLSFMPHALRESVEKTLDTVNVAELMFLVETGIILMQDILILMKFIVMFTIMLITLIVGGSIATVTTGGTVPAAVLTNPQLLNKVRESVTDPAINGVAHALKVAQEAIIDILRITGRMLELSQKYYDLWMESPFLPGPGDLANALNPYTQMGHDFYCLMPTSLNQSRTLVTSGYAISRFMNQWATIDTKPLAVQIQKTADSLDNMRRYNNKIINKSVKVYSAIGDMMDGKAPSGGSLADIKGPVSTAIPGIGGGTTFSNEGSPSLPVGSSTGGSSILGPTFSNASALKTVPGLNIGKPAQVSSAPIPVGQTVSQNPALSGVIPSLFPSASTRTPALYEQPSSGWTPIQNAAVSDVASSGLITEKVIRTMIDSAGTISAEVPRLASLLAETPSKVINAGKDSDDADDEIDIQTVALFITDLSRTLFDTLDLFMITRAFIMPFITSFLHMSFMMIVLSSPGKNDLPIVGHALNLLEPGMTFALHPLANAVNSPEFVHMVARSPLVTVGPTVTRILVNMSVRAQVVGSIAEAVAFPEDTTRRFTDSYLGITNEAPDMYESGVPVVDANNDGDTTSSTDPKFSNDSGSSAPTQLPNSQSFSNQ